MLIDFFMRLFFVSVFCYCIEIYYMVSVIVRISFFKVNMFVFWRVKGVVFFYFNNCM